MGTAEHEQGLASGLQSLQLGGAVGLAVVAAVNVAATDGNSASALLVPVAAVVLGLAVTGTALLRVRRRAATAASYSG